MTAQGLRIIGVWTVTFVLAAGYLAACTPVSQLPVRAAPPIEGTLIGARLSEFGLAPSRQAGVSTFNDQLLVRWETIADTPIVTGIATGWSLEEQRTFLDSGGSLASISNQFVRQWAPSDAVYVSDNRLGVGGLAVFAYRSDQLREAFGRSTVNRTEAGDLYVVIVLDSVYESSEVPIVAAEFANHTNLENAMFTVAVLSGQPWGKRKQ